MLAMAQLLINNQEAAFIGVSPFFLTHSYNIDVVQLKGEL
jgi:flagellar assembly factor FliW